MKNWRELCNRVSVCTTDSVADCGAQENVLREHIRNLDFKLILQEYYKSINIFNCHKRLLELDSFPVYQKN